MTTPTTPARVIRQACTTLLSHEERETIRVAAALRGVSTSTYLRDCALETAARERSEAA